MSILNQVCVTTNNHKICVLEERRSKVNIHNPHRLTIQKIRVDGCLITKGIRCDFLILVDKIDESLFIELKGSEIEHAYDQINESHKILREHCKSRETWIISTARIPRGSTKWLLRIRELYEKSKINLIISTSPVDYTFPEV